MKNRESGFLSFRIVTEASLKEYKYTFVVVLLMYWAATTFRIFTYQNVTMDGNLIYQARALFGKITESVFNTAIHIIGLF